MESRFVRKIHNVGFYVFAIMSRFGYEGKKIITLLLLLLCISNYLTGEVVVFTKQDSADWTLPENQDRIADSVWITRKHNQSIFNIAQESGYSGSSGSPVNTLWAGTAISEAENGDFVSFVTMHGGSPQLLIDDTVALYLPQYGEYYDVVFLSYSGGNNGGGFSYSREQMYPDHLHINNHEITPNQVLIHQNYPNPFNPVTTLRYELLEDSFVKITIFDMLGNQINNLISQNQSSGFNVVQWNATNDAGSPVSAGLYLYAIQAGEFRQTRKMILLK